MGSVLRHVITGIDLTYALAATPRRLFIDGIYARLVITRNDNVQIDGQPGRSMNVNPSDFSTGPLVLEWPIVYDTDGLPIRYSQELRFSCLTDSFISGSLFVLYDARSK